MNINWSNFLLVAAASIGASALIVTVFSLGMRALSNAEFVASSAKKGDLVALRRESLSRAIAYALFAISAAAVLYGIYLIVPYFHLAK